MNIIVVGGGVVGYSLAEQLLHEKHTVTVIEKEPSIGEGMVEKMDLQVLISSGSSPQALEDAGIDKADMVIAVTPVDEINILVCSIARQYGVGQRIARLRSREFVSPDRKISLVDLGVTDFIFPEMVVVDAILQYIDTPGASHAVNFENGEILLRGYNITEKMAMAGKSLIELRQIMDDQVFLVAAVQRGGEGIIPPGDFVIEPGDRVFSLFPRQAISSFMNLVGGNNEVKRVIISGNNISTQELAMALEHKVPHVFVVSPDREHAEEMAAALSKAEVIHGDCTETDSLREAEIRRADFFIAASSEPDYNMLSALLARSEGVRETVAVSMEYQHDRLFHSLGIDHVINPRVIAAREIMQLISRGYIGGTTRLGPDIEAIRIEVMEGSRAIGVPLKNLWKKFRSGALIGIIIRGDKMIIPGGETTFEAGDHVITIAYNKIVSRVRNLFRVES